ncbi:hypothetical protein A2Y99_03300 [Candidatus Gottesmanbacteria bacterium RBG_13_37_7]|uniref:DDH domain-containing protein n=1 Tax=Candidatus Gottesmanbacteria bacterium RBG_13_37_7 TaxID=1798369 RepID=A0A1F5YJS8_9BACT|nr:MAG: hypothetical protein A2Y99_03300 [Candidatus Gottesmanbacteria bacterium RBG_13_37_7]
MTNIASDLIQNSRSALEQAQSILIAIPENPSVDSVASGLAFYLALASTGKQTALICSSPMTVEFSHLIGVDKISNALNNHQGNNLTISFPYQEGSIEKVSYNIENNVFNLVIEPRNGFPTVTEDLVKYSYSGGTTDLIITIGATQFTDLGNIYTNNQQIFQNKKIINIDINSQNRNFGKINIIDPESPSISELSLSLLSLLGFSNNPDIATDIFIGINAATNNFSSANISATTFEAAALCMKYGAKKSSFQSISRPEQKPPQVSLPSFIPKPFPKNQKSPPLNQMPLSNQPQANISYSKPSTAGFKKPQQTDNSQKETPPDWLKPKIYKGSTLL